MKKLILVNVLLLSCLASFGQGNLFPASGNVGIGTLTPNYNLEVAGSLNTADLFVNGIQMQGTPWSVTPTSISYNGTVGIGITNVPIGYELAVLGSIISEGITVKLESDGWPDFVFENDYLLPDLKQVENYINTNGHLPNIPSAKEIEKDGVNLGDMNAKLLQKIEELTLYTIHQQKEIDGLKETNKILVDENSLLKTLVKRLDKIEQELNASEQ